MRELRCVVVDDEPPARKRVKELLAKATDAKVVGEARNGTEAIAVITDTKPDIVFLDIQMPEHDGFEVLAALETPPPAVVFVTAFDAYALKAFEVHALDYLLKPFDGDRFSAALERARSSVANHPSADDPRLLALLHDLTARDQCLTRVAVKSRGRIRLIPVEDIERVEASGNYLKLHTALGPHLLRETMNGLEERLDARQFARIHRSTIVNISAIVELKPSSHGDCTVTLRSGVKVTLSRTHREKLKDRLGPDF